MAQANLLDRAIAWIAPAAGLKRAEARAKAGAIGRATALYDGATRSYRTAGRQIGSTSANGEIVNGLERLRDVSRDLARNNAYAARAVALISANVVGAGIVPSVHADGARVKSALQGFIREHLATPAIDFAGRLDFSGLQALAMRTVAESGEALLVRASAPKGSALSFTVRLLEPDYLDVRKDGPLRDGGCVFRGVEFDQAGRRVAYWLFREHPGDVTRWQLPDSMRVEASEVIHLYRLDRPGQVRGVPWAAPVVMTLWDLADYEDAELLRQKVAACFAGFITDTDGRQSLGAPAADQASRGGLVVDMMEPGTMQRLTPGQDIKFSTPPTTLGYPEYTRAQIRKIAVGYGVPYEAISGDLSQVNFSSGRMGWLEFARGVDQWRWHMLIPHACGGVGRWFLEAAEIQLGRKLAGLASLEWTPPRREMIDPTKEIPAARDAIRAGLSSRSEELRKQGLDPEQVERELADENKRADAAGLSFDSDGRRPLAGPVTVKEDPANAAS